MPRSAAWRGVAVRHGDTVTHVASAIEAAAFVKLLAAPDPASDAGFRSALIDTAAFVLGALVAKFSFLCGPAESSLSTALRVREIRESFGSSRRGQQLLATLEHIARGADALRHLTVPLMRKATAALQDHLSAMEPSGQAGRRPLCWGGGVSGLQEMIALVPESTVAAAQPDTSQEGLACSLDESSGDVFGSSDDSETVSAAAPHLFAEADREGATRHLGGAAGGADVGTC